MTAVVLAGGYSLQRASSQASGQYIAAGLRDLGLAVEIIDPDQQLMARLLSSDYQFAFLALHGPGGEDGLLQDLLEVINLPYSGTAARGSELAFNKHWLKALLQKEGVSTPGWLAIDQSAIERLGAGAIMEMIIDKLGLPLVIKPATQGGGLGIKLANTPEQLAVDLVNAFAYDQRLLLEQYRPGRHLSVTVLGPAEKPQILPIVETEDLARPELPGEQKIVAAELSAAERRAVESAATAGYQLISGRDLAQVDIIFTQQPEILEINTIPELTIGSPAVRAAEISGLSATELISAISARLRHNN